MALLEGTTAGDDVVAVEQGAGDGLADAVDINRGSGDEGNDVTDRGRQKAGDHQNTEPTHIDAVVGIGDPLAKALPGALTTAAKSSGHENDLVVMKSTQMSGPKRLGSDHHITSKIFITSRSNVDLMRLRVKQN